MPEEIKLTAQMRVTPKIIDDIDLIADWYESLHGHRPSRAWVVGGLADAALRKIKVKKKRKVKQ